MTLSEWRRRTARELNDQKIKVSLVPGVKFLYSCFTVFASVLRCVAELHDCWMVHNDLKCDNVLVNTSGTLSNVSTVVLTDFGALTGSSLKT